LIILEHSLSIYEPLAIIFEHLEAIIEKN